MFNALFKKIKGQLNQYKVFRSISGALKRTPMYAIHWYVVMLFGLAVVVVSVGAAWVLFESVSNKNEIDSNEARNTTVIEGDALQEALTIYRARKEELERLKVSPPTIIDPGR